MDNHIKTIKKPVGIHVEAIDHDEPFIETAARFAHLYGTVTLLSGGDMKHARHHILAADPWLVLAAKGRSIRLLHEGRWREFTGNPLVALKKLTAGFKVKQPEPFIPVGAGLFGYLSYDLKDCIERLPRTSIDDLGLPDLYMSAPRVILVHDRRKSETRLCIPIFSKKEVGQTRENFYAMLKKTAPDMSEPCCGVFTSNFTKERYCRAISRVLDYIRAGDVYQVNISQRFEASFQGSPYALFSMLYKKNPAPFFAYINAGDHHVVSTSPERFLFRNGSHIETMPIKGTRPRGETADQDMRNREELVQSVKDDAELSMIVDLLRNDLGKVCRRGSVKVAAHKTLEAYENVFHMVSTVEGRLAKGIDSADIIAAAFPGGSITGCPKIRSMEIIDELEPCRRHVYTGSIGYISFHDTMDLSIAIRTAIISNDRLLYAAGGGIVYDSVAEDEFDETLAKAKTMLKAFEKNRPSQKKSAYVWMNGRIIPDQEATVPVALPGFQYGAGIFETILWNGHLGPCLLEAHIKRFESSWRSIMKGPVPDLTWDEIIWQVVAANRLENETAAVKIMAAMGERETAPFDTTLIVTARPYKHRLETLGKNGLELATYPEPRQIETARHKTMNYLFYLAAGRWAKQRGADEALITNPDGTLSETNTANLLFVAGKTVITPLSPTALRGITQSAALDLLRSRGYDTREEPVPMNFALESDGIIVTNSLMGAVPVLGIDGKKTGCGQHGLCEKINRGIMG